MMAARVHEGRITAAVRENIGRMMGATISSIIRDLLTERLSSALNASAPAPVEVVDAGGKELEDGVITTQEEISGFHIVQAIASKLVDPKRIIIRDAKSYCAILLDDNNRKTIARLHFNGLTSKYFGTFSGKEEQRNLISELTQIYQYAPQIEARLRELDDSIGS